VSEPGAPIRIGIVGLGKIALDHHVPSLLADARFELVAGATPSGRAPVDFPVYASLGAMVSATPALDAVAIATPPQVRYELAREALDHGLHVLLEKPLATSVTDAYTILHAVQRSDRVVAMGVNRRGEGYVPSMTSVPFGKTWLARFYRVSFQGSPAQQWRVGGLRFFRSGEPVGIGGPFDFTSAWKPGVSFSTR